SVAERAIMFMDPRLTNIIANLLALLAVLAFLGGAVLWVAQRPYFAISRLQLEAAPDSERSYVSAATVRATVAGGLKGNFFSIDLDEARKLVETVPWVRQASIRRVWPNTLRVQIEEQQPLALWNENQMINSWGEAFAAN